MKKLFTKYSFELAFILMGVMQIILAVSAAFSDMNVLIPLFALNALILPFQILAAVIAIKKTREE